MAETLHRSKSPTVGSVVPCQICKESPQEESSVKPIVCSYANESINDVSAAVDSLLEPESLSICKRPFTPPGLLFAPCAIVCSVAKEQDKFRSSNVADRVLRAHPCVLTAALCSTAHLRAPDGPRSVSRHPVTRPVYLCLFVATNGCVRQPLGTRVFSFNILWTRTTDFFTITTTSCCLPWINSTQRYEAVYLKDTLIGCIGGSTSNDYDLLHSLRLARKQSNGPAHAQSPRAVSHQGMPCHCLSLHARFSTIPIYLIQPRHTT